MPFKFISLTSLPMLWASLGLCFNLWAADNPNPAVSAKPEVKPATSPDTKQTLQSGVTTAGSSGLNGGLGGSPEQKVPGSQIFSTTFKIEKGTAADFVLNGLLDLEKVVADYNKAKGAEASHQEARIRQTVSSLLDLDSLAHGALVTYWDDFGKKKMPTLKDRERFRALFKELVEQNYLDKARQYIDGKYQIVLTEEKPQRNGTGHVVGGRIKKTDVDVIVEFLVNKGKEGKDRIMDIKLDETSLEATYRGSFNSIVKKKGGFKAGFPELMNAMSKRLKELKKGSGKSI